MNKEELKNIPGLKPEDSVTIWKMNYGFKSDLNGVVNEISAEAKGKAMDGKAVINVTQMRLMNLVYGIFESLSLDIKAPGDLGLGLSTGEINQRLRVIRNLDGQAGDFIFSKIIKMNKEPSDDLKKK